MFDLRWRVVAMLGSPNLRTPSWLWASAMASGVDVAAEEIQPRGWTWLL